MLIVVVAILVSTIGLGCLNINTKPKPTDANQPTNPANKTDVNVGGSHGVTVEHYSND